MLRHVERVRQVVEAAGIKFTALHAEHDFEYYLVEHPPKRKETSAFFGRPGLGWPGVFSRWCTKALKQKSLDDYFRNIKERYTVLRHIGIAADEDYRMERGTNQNLDHRYPLREWGWAEADALQYCRAKGYDWEGLYDIFNRVSCWCCPLQSHAELRKLRKHFPDLWTRLLDLDARQCKPFNHGYSVADFDLRFRLEDALTAASHSIKSRAFFADLKRLLAGETTIDEILQERTTTS